MPRSKEGKPLTVALSDYLLVDRSHHTNGNYRNVLTPLVDWLGSQSPPVATLKAVTFTHLNRYLDSVLIGRQKAGTMSGRTPHQHVVVIRGFFNWCVKIGYLGKSPAAGLTIRKPKAKPPETRAIPLEVFREMLRRAKLLAQAGEPNLYALLTLLAETTHRIGALVKIKVADVDFKARRILLEEKGGAWLYAHFADPEVIWALQALIQWRSLMSIPHEYLFTTHRRPWRPVSPGAASSRVGAASAAICGVEYHAHSIRHLMATLMDAQGVEPTAASARLGNTPEVYAGHYQPSPGHERAKRVTEAYPFQKLLGGPTPLPPAPASPPGKVTRVDWRGEEAG